MTPELTITGGLLLGLFGGLHCIGMCGGIVSALAGAGPDGRVGHREIAAQLLYSAGRISSYTLAGAIAGGLGWSLLSLLGADAARALRVLAGAFLVAAGLYLAGWWLGLARLERVGARAWRHIAPLSKKLQPLDRSWKRFAAGAVWGWLPCGLVYAALAGASASGGAATGAAMMAAFGVGTLPALLAAGTLSQTIQSRVQTRRLAGALLVVFGLWTIAAVAIPGGHDHAHDAAEHPAQHEGAHAEHGAG
jgi:sulfite exporter TauE/SafE